MCTVTFLPYGVNSFILTSNRDEKSARLKAMPPRKFKINRHSVFYPKDLEAGGTWIATGSNNYTVCLLNGAYVKHPYRPPYKKSRGLMLLDFFEVNDIEKFVSTYDFKGIQPFTLLIVDSTASLGLHELIWDGEKLTHSVKAVNTAHMWSSVTLYDEDVIEKRSSWFQHWLSQNTNYEMENIMNFHEFGGTGDKDNDLKMNRSNETLTVSITSIHKTGTGTFMKYRDLEENKLYNIRII
jgi:uncharacterized protein with NRDE domain